MKKLEIIIILLGVFLLSLYNASATQPQYIEPVVNCTTNIINSSWGEWQEESACDINNKKTEIRNLVTYDSNNCGEIDNETIYEYREALCDFCTPNIETFYTDWSVCKVNNKKYRTKYYDDLNYEICCKKTNKTDDCIIETYSNETESIACKQFNITILNPEEKVYGSKRILLSVISDANLSRLSYTDSYDKKPFQKPLCSKCFMYNKSINLNEGWHKLTIIGTSLEGRSSEEEVNFLVDTKRPQILPSRVRRQGFTNGSFSVIYSEDNVKEVTLFYQDKSTTKTDCPSGKNQECRFDVDLSNEDGEIISYSFKVLDVAGNYYNSKNFSSLVDTIPPEIVQFNYNGVVMGIDFNIEVNEPNFLDISYYDHSDKYARWKILCPVLKNGFCIKRLSFRPGEHQITIKISDKAGNYVLREI